MPPGGDTASGRRHSEALPLTPGGTFLEAVGSTASGGVLHMLERAS